MPQLSVVIITFNEEKNITRCLDSIKDIADDIVVVDSFSIDNTPSVCKQYQVNFIQKEWQGYSATKNFANAQAKCNWVLSLDADEALTEELKQSILEMKKQPEAIACKFNRLTNYCGSWIRHGGWYPDTKVRIFDRNKIQWEGLIHERLNIASDNSAVLLKGDCLHYSYYSTEEHYKQADRFTTLVAKDLYQKGVHTSFIQIWISPIVKFIRDYIFKLGFIDGAAGFTVSRISAYATYLKYKKLKRLHASNGKDVD
jgi:glycosyltransferase involved in cell wall biosynthesis